MQVAKLGRKAMPTPARIGRAIVDALIGAVVGLIAGAPAGVMFGSLGMTIPFGVMLLLRDGPPPDIGIGFTIVGGAMMGLFTIPVGPAVGAVVGAVAGVRSLGGAIAVGCGAGIGAVGGLLAGMGIVLLAGAFTVLSGFISHEGPFHYLAHVFEFLAHIAAYLAYNDLMTGVSFIVAAGVVVGICAGVVIGRILKRQQTVI